MSDIKEEPNARVSRAQKNQIKNWLQDDRRKPRERSNRGRSNGRNQESRVDSQSSSSNGVAYKNYFEMEVGSATEKPSIVDPSSMDSLAIDQPDFVPAEPLQVDSLSSPKRQDRVPRNDDGRIRNEWRQKKQDTDRRGPSNDKPSISSSSSSPIRDNTTNPRDDRRGSNRGRNSGNGRGWSDVPSPKKDGRGGDYGNDSRDRRGQSDNRSDFGGSGSYGDNEREKRSATLYSLWKTNSQGQGQSSGGRGSNTRDRDRDRDQNSRSSKSENAILNRNPSMRDVGEVIFLPTSQFIEGEIVLVPRTRGGFSYAKISRQILKSHCFFDSNAEHKTVIWRVVYSSGGKTLFKDLPSPYIGKLKTQPSTSDSFDSDDFSSSDTPERIVGSKPHIKDLQNMIFSPECSFSPDEIVLVARSAGGFTYGRLVKETQQSCKLADPMDSHPLTAWKVIVSEDDSNNVTRKEVCSACIGKTMLFTSNATANEVNIRKVLTFNNLVLDPQNLKKESELEEEQKNQTRAKRREGRQRSRGGGPQNRGRGQRNPQQEDRRQDMSNDQINESFEEDIGDLDDFGQAKTGSSGEEDYVPLTQAPSSQSEQPAVLDLTSFPELPKVEKKVEELPRSNIVTVAQMNQIGGLLSVDKKELLKQLMVPKTISRKNKHIILIDGPNVAMKHGKDTDFSAKGIEFALDYWNSRGHDAIAFVPQHYVTRKPGTGQVTLMEFMPKANNVPLLKQLIDENRVVLTPPQDYDDSYCIEYGMLHDCCIVTNDRYNDHVEKMSDKGDRIKYDTRKWIREHCISYTFVRDEFLPNPNFKFPPLAEQ